MKLKSILLTGVLVMAMCVSAVFAEEPAEQEEASGGLLESLFGEGGPLADTLPEGTDVGAMSAVLNEQLGQADSEISQVLGNVLDKVESAGSSLSGESLESLAGDLLGPLLGGGEDFDFSSLDALLEMTDSFRAAEEQYIKDRNADMMDFGDVQIISNNSVYTNDYDTDTVEITNLTDISQYNYRLDDENQLWFVSGTEDIALFRHEKDEEGNYPVVEATFAEDGENYTPSIEKMCEEVGITSEECFESIETNEWMVVYDLKEYLDNNPDIKGIEYDGEIRTAEELDQIWGDMLAELYPPEEEMTEVELTEEEVVTEETESLE